MDNLQAVFVFQLFSSHVFDLFKNIFRFAQNRRELPYAIKKPREVDEMLESLQVFVLGYYLAQARLCRGPVVEIPQPRAESATELKTLRAHCVGCVGRVRAESIVLQILAIVQDLLDLRVVLFVEMIELGCSHREVDFTR